MHISEIMSELGLKYAIEDGFVKVQTHPTLPLRIFNYTDKAVYAREWSNVVRRSRGLILDDNDEVVATGPQKFFNVGEPTAKEYPLDTKVNVTQKHDGSLGIAYYYDGVFGVATRGSFMSDQAVHATKLINSNEYEWLRDTTFEKFGDTPIVEIVYPQNRIVLDYSELDALLPLGLVDDATGTIITRTIGLSPEIASDGLVTHSNITLAEAISLPIPDDEEGYVLDVLDNVGLRTYTVVDHLKLKGAEYLRRHKIISGLSEKSIYDYMTEKDDIKVYISELPDEFQDWATKIVEKLNNNLHDKLKEVEDHFNLIGPTNSRKEFAIEASKYSTRPYLFQRYDGNANKLHSAVWGSLKPKAV